jgi:hypothetical protein
MSNEKKIKRQRNEGRQQVRCKVKEREVLSLLEKNNLEKKIKFGLDVKKKRERQKKKKNGKVAFIYFDLGIDI